ncbi:PulJ/GspJ family protein [Persicirhabdus sediminis]|uniref:Type II secretion system protein n=1 Tax=Persicirhabdus sediminis TaxID=454144 RepID=A0A8J7MAZ1_9BACT|nr:type II secretion system protein [Persicirhabdus sediminis]MBK1790179.1 type II secretion system protein [Persicirhabdus sediminis]
MKQHLDTNTTRSNNSPLEVGFTLVELTVVIGMMVIIAGMGMGLLSQQARLQNILSNQNFLVDDAPQISNMIGRISQRADRYQVFNNLAQATVQRPVGVASGQAITFIFRDALGNKEFGLLSGATEDGMTTLTYHYGDNAIPDQTPLWTVAQWKAPADGSEGVTFSSENGILTISLVGPHNERITYAATAQL